MGWRTEECWRLIGWLPSQSQSAADSICPPATSITPDKHVLVYCAGIFIQSMGAMNRVGTGLSYRAAGEIGSLESILGVLKSLKIRALYAVAVLYSRSWFCVWRPCALLPAPVFMCGQLKHHQMSSMQNFRSPGRFF